MLHLRGCDVLLDTTLFNAQTTAADMLWAGVPIVTWPSTRSGKTCAVGVDEEDTADGSGESQRLWEEHVREECL